MNYYRVNTTYFLIFIAISAIAFAAIPVMKNSFADVSDNYAKSQLTRIQGEMIFTKHKQGGFENTCVTGNVGLIVEDLIDEYGKKVVCRTNSDYSQLIVYVQLRSGEYVAVDSTGITCQTSFELENQFSCKDV